MIIRNWCNICFPWFAIKTELIIKTNIASLESNHTSIFSYYIIAFSFFYIKALNFGEYIQLLRFTLDSPSWVTKGISIFEISILNDLLKFCKIVLGLAFHLMGDSLSVYVAKFIYQEVDISLALTFTCLSYISISWFLFNWFSFAHMKHIKYERVDSNIGCLA